MADGRVHRPLTLILGLAWRYDDKETSYIREGWIDRPYFNRPAIYISISLRKVLRIINGIIVVIL